MLKRFFLLDHGIIHQTIILYTPQKNRQVKQKHHNILNVAHALQFQAILHISFWGECVLTAIHLINRSFSSLLHGKLLLSSCMGPLVILIYSKLLVVYVMYMIQPLSMTNLIPEVASVFLLGILLVRKGGKFFILSNIIL